MTVPKSLRVKELSTERGISLNEARNIVELEDLKLEIEQATTVNDLRRVLLKMLDIQSKL